MRVIRADLEVPFWCSFSEYGTVNIRPTYPFPPPTTLFGLIQNALQKPALHDLTDNDRKGIGLQYIEDYSKLNFAIIINESGEKIDDYLNIHKGSREIEGIESSLKEELQNRLNDLNLHENDEKKLKKELNKLKRKNFSENFVKITNNQKISEKDEKQILALLELIKAAGADELLTFIQNFWNSFNDGINGYNLNKKWISTQINRQRLITPNYTIYVSSKDSAGEYSIDSIYGYLKSPKRPLYLGESDDIVIVNKLTIKEVNDELIKSVKIDSVIPGVHSNCQLVKIPSKLKNDFPDEKGHNLICSIPQGDLDQELSCLDVEGEHIVFLRSDSEE